MLNAWLILDKPTGITSAHAVAKVKTLLSSSRAIGEAGISCHMDGDPRPRKARSRMTKIGHAGTLDPLASGVLPLALGEATKTVPYMMDGEKSYGFTVTWGQERDTDDAQGQVVRESDKRPTDLEIIALLPKFIGNIQQLPPDYSAIKVGGKRAYDAARGGKPLELKAREVMVDSLELTSPGRGEVDERSEEGGGSTGNISPSLTLPPTGGGNFSEFICHCGKGTYIRSLARDMGRELGCFGYISVLRRLRVGKFDETHAISLESLEKMMHKGDLSFLRPVESALDDILAWDVSSDQAVLLRRGQTLSLPGFLAEEPDGTKVLARYEDKALAICEVSLGSVKPVRVFNLSGE